jgi:hypothetical protein
MISPETRVQIRRLRSSAAGATTERSVAGGLAEEQPRLLPLPLHSNTNRIEPVRSARPSTCILIRHCSTRPTQSAGRSP